MAQGWAGLDLDLWALQAADAPQRRRPAATSGGRNISALTIGLAVLDYWRDAGCYICGASTAGAWLDVKYNGEAHGGAECATCGPLGLGDGPGNPFLWAKGVSDAG